MFSITARGVRPGPNSGPESAAGKKRAETDAVALALLLAREVLAVVSFGFLDPSASSAAPGFGGAGRALTAVGAAPLWSGPEPGVRLLRGDRLNQASVMTSNTN